MDWGSAPLSDSHAGRFHEEVGSLGAGRRADGQMFTSLDEYLGAWEHLRKYDHFVGPLIPLLLGQVICSVEGDALELLELAVQQWMEC